MADTGPEDVEKRALLAFLEAQRAIVLAIMAGMADDALRTPVLPSGWTPLGLVKHFGFAERHWFQRVATGSAGELPWTAMPGEEEGRKTIYHRPARRRRVQLLPGPVRARQCHRGGDAVVGAAARQASG
jgi:hypothetical protein